MKNRILLVVLVGLLSILVGVGVTLSGSPTVVIGTNSILEGGEEGTSSNSYVCQDGEVLPAGTRAVRLFLNMGLGAKVGVSAFEGNQVLASGARASGWRGADVTIPVKRLPRTYRNVRLCVTVGPSVETVGLLGARAPAGQAAVLDGTTALPLRVRVEYVAPASASWWSLRHVVSTRMGLGRAWTGVWVALLAVLLMVVAAIATSTLLLRRLT